MEHMFNNHHNVNYTHWLLQLIISFCAYPLRTNVCGHEESIVCNSLPKVTQKFKPVIFIIAFMGNEVLFENSSLVSVNSSIGCTDTIFLGNIESCGRVTSTKVRFIHPRNAQGAMSLKRKETIILGFIYVTP